VFRICEDILIRLQRRFQLEGESESRPNILNELDYCFLRLGRFEEAVKVDTESVGVNPFDNDSRFYLASAFASLK